MAYVLSSVDSVIPTSQQDFLMIHASADKVSVLREAATLYSSQSFPLDASSAYTAMATVNVWSNIMGHILLAVRESSCRKGKTVYGWLIGNTVDPPIKLRMLVAGSKEVGLLQQYVENEEEENEEVEEEVPKDEAEIQVDSKSRRRIRQAYYRSVCLCLFTCFEHF
ncbi:hypothetical protein ACFE04_007674 [Oxalis oulophora]